MKRLFMLILSLVVFQVVYSQTGVTGPDEPAAGICEKFPEFPGGIDSLQSFLIQNTNYPKVAIEKNVQGTVMVEFVVEKDGSISNVVVKESLSPECDNEAVRVVKSMPRWMPGESKGEKVRVYYNLPFRFAL